MVAGRYLRARKGERFVSIIAIFSLVGIALGVATLVAVVDIFLITALATIGAFLYNITAALVGGVHVTMTDE